MMILLSYNKPRNYTLKAYLQGKVLWNLELCIKLQVCNLYYDTELHYLEKRLMLPDLGIHQDWCTHTLVGFREGRSSQILLVQE